MNHIPAGGYPPNYTKQAMDRFWGPDLSDAASDAIDVHARIQHQIMQLRQLLKANDATMCVAGLYEELGGALQDATFTPQQIEDHIADEEADRIQDARWAAQEAKYEARRDGEF